MTTVEPFPPIIEPNRSLKPNPLHHHVSTSTAQRESCQSITESWDIFKSIDLGFNLPTPSQSMFTWNPLNQPLGTKVPSDITPWTGESSILCQDSQATDDSVYQKTDEPVRGSRPFAVSKVGNNGKIYLRPTTRPINELNLRSSILGSPIDSSLKFPPFAARRASLDSITCSSGIGTHLSIFTSNTHGATRTLTQTQSTSNLNRCFSVNSIGEDNLCISNYNYHNDNNFNDNDQKFPTHSNFYIHIPSYKLGSPHFTAGGTPFLSQTPSRRHSDASRNPYFSTISQLSTSCTQTTPTKGIFEDLMIKPEVFDILTLEALRDHPSVVRYSGGGKISAATPIRLVAEITSPTIMDYDLLSSFFLTFRSFLETAALMHMLFARLEWSFLRPDSVGLVVSVRTFVAMRHWILNYFLDDFLHDLELRKIFCDLVNDSVNKLTEDSMRFKVALKTLGELKKCWIKACGAHWKCPELTTEQCISTPIGPGGTASSDHSVPDKSCRIVNQAHQLPEQEKRTLISNNNKPMIRLDCNNIVENDLSPIPITTTTILISKTLHKIPLSPGSMMNIDAISYPIDDQQKVTKVENHNLIHLKSVKSIRNMKKGFSATKKSNRSNEDHATHFRQNPEPSRENIQSCPPDQETHRIPNLKPTPAVETNLSSSKAEQPGSSHVHAKSPHFLKVAPEPTCVSYPFSNYKESNSNQGPGIKKLFGNLRRALINRTDQTINSSRTHKYINTLQPCAREKPTRKPSICEKPQIDHAFITAIKGPERYDILNVEAAKELHSINDVAYTFVDTRSLNRSIIHTDKLENANSHTDRNSWLSPNTNRSRVISQASTETKFAAENGSSPRSLAISDFFSHSSNRSSMTACTRALGGPTPPTTPDISSKAPQNIFKSVGTCGEDKIPPIEETPSLFVDSYFSEYEKPRLHSPRTRSFKQSLNDLSFELQASSQLHPPYPSGLKKWKSNPSFDTATFSDDEINSPKSTLNHPPLSLHLRTLRRRPGGYLRSVNYPDNVDLYSNRGQISSGFCPTYYTTYSGQDTSIALDQESIICDNSQNSHLMTTFGRVTKYQSRSPIIPLGSSIFTGSFENEVQFLAHLPDIEDDDGTVEAALLKLEGKFAKPIDEAPESYNCSCPPAMASLQDVSDLNQTLSPTEGVEKRKHRKYVLDTNLKTSALLSDVSNNQDRINKQINLASNVYQSRDASKVSLVCSDSLEKTIPDFSYLNLNPDDNVDSGPWYKLSPRCNSQESNEKLPVISSPYTPNLSVGNFGCPNPKLNATNASDRTPHRNNDMNSSFLYMDSDNEHEVSQNDSNETLPRENNNNSASALEICGSFLSFTSNDATNESQNPQIGISIPQVTVSQIDLIPEMDGENDIAQSHFRSTISKNYENLPAPTSSFNKTLKTHGVASISLDPLRINRISVTPKTTATDHLPFILAFSSDDLAQQFTLVEKEIVSEIKWRDLVEMKWKDSFIDLNVRSWAKFINSYDSPHGIEAIITRSNLMIKWVVSECVLTTDLSERVCCLIKLIHVADKSRKYRNFATMSQIVTALMTPDIACLTKTWEHVPSPEIQTFRNLVGLLDKSNNYYHLRAEMESVNLEQGCIPLVQIYTHDLLANYGNPVFVTSSSKAVSLINYKRYHTNANIIKSLLRILDSIQNYKFYPNDNIIQRCYWISALSDEQISAKRNLIQP